MANLKDLKVRIDSVKSTRKITSAMKMVAAAKLRRAQENAEAARAYSERMSRMFNSVASSFAGQDSGPKMLAGTGSDQTHLLVACTADRGLCGGFNGSIIRATRRTARELLGQGKTVKILCVGTKGRDVLKQEFADNIIDTVAGIGKKGVQYEEAVGVSEKITALFDAGEFDVCTVVFNKFKSAMTQIVTAQQLIPYEAKVAANDDAGELKAQYIFEPDEEEILADLLPRNLAVQVFQSMLESAASEHGARMAAMDNATRNAGDMINKLTLTYNRARQANITKELIEIISGAEAL